MLSQRTDVARENPERVITFEAQERSSLFPARFAVGTGSILTIKIHTRLHHQNVSQITFKYTAERLKISEVDAVYHLVVIVADGRWTDSRFLCKPRL